MSLGETSLGEGITDHAHCLDVDEFAQPELAQLTPVTACLHTAKGEAGIRGNHAVDEYAARLELRREPLGLRAFSGPSAGAEAEPSSIRDSDRILDVACAQKGRERPEGLVRESRSLWRHIGEHCRFV